MTDLLFSKTEAIPETVRNPEVIILPAGDVFDTLAAVDKPVTATILDPWYNKGVGGVRDDYHDWLIKLVREICKISEHVFLWGFAEIVHNVLNHLPEDYKLIAWLTWYYKNCPSVVRGWRPSQLACLHLGRLNAGLYPENFFNDEQKERYENGNMRFVPGPPSVLETPLLVGFVGKNEQTGHPAQKPLDVIKPLILMTTKENDWVLDPMCGSGTTGEACLTLNRNSILSDASEEYLAMTEERLKQKRI
jgi:hypothetical protein